MRDDLVAAIEEVTGRTVEAFLSDTCTTRTCPSRSSS